MESAILGLVLDSSVPATKLRTIAMTIKELTEIGRRNGKETSRTNDVVKMRGTEDEYLHAINKPTEKLIRDEVAAEMDLPQALVAHFEGCNGGSLYCASATCIGINLFGCVPRQSRLNRNLDDDWPPLDIRRSNRPATDYILFASYGYDASLVLVDRRHQTVRCCAGRDLSRTRQEWSSIEEWLGSEIDRLAKLFTPEGLCLVECKDLVPSKGD